MKELILQKRGNKNAILRYFEFFLQNNEGVRESNNQT